MFRGGAEHTKQAVRLFPTPTLQCDVTLWNKHNSTENTCFIFITDTQSSESDRKSLDTSSDRISAVIKVDADMTGFKQEKKRMCECFFREERMRVAFFLPDDEYFLTSPSYPSLLDGFPQQADDVFPLHATRPEALRPRHQDALKGDAAVTMETTRREVQNHWCVIRKINTFYKNKHAADFLFKGRS